PDNQGPAKHEDPDFSSEQTALADQEFARHEADGASGQVTRVDSPLNQTTDDEDGATAGTVADADDLSDSTTVSEPSLDNAATDAEDDNTFKEPEEPARSDDGSVA